MHLWKNESLTSATSDGEPIAECLTALPHTLRTSPVVAGLGLKLPAQALPTITILATVNSAITTKRIERFSIYAASTKGSTNESAGL